MYVLYYMSMFQCWHLVWILIRTNHPCLGVGCHNWFIRNQECKCVSWIKRYQRKVFGKQKIGMQYTGNDENWDIFRLVALYYCMNWSNFLLRGGHYLLEFMFGIWLNMMGCHEGIQMSSVVCITTCGKWTIHDQLFADCITKICSQTKSVSVIRQLNFFPNHHMMWHDRTIPYLANHYFDMIEPFFISTSVVLLLWPIYALPLCCHW
jgi:hypothetical protein